VYRLWFILRRHAPVINTMELSSYREYAIGHMLFERAMPQTVAFRGNPVLLQTWFAEEIRRLENEYGQRQ
jgi:hypothetical protein